MTTPTSYSTPVDLSAPPEAEWRYEMRRECQEILPGLLLGPLTVSKQLEKLTSYGVTHIVCIRDAKEAFSVYPRFPDKFSYMVLDVEDSEEQNLIRLFPGAQIFIQQAIAAGGRVLVHCNGGISLSPSFAIMFVMQHFKLSWEDALQYVQNRRYCISPNGGFLTQLKEWESIYRARQAVAGFSNSGYTRSVSRRKRSDDEDDDEDSVQRVPEARRRYYAPETDTEMA
ncbi:protein-tyrosine phosphatase-like protein [Cantharellus anzutake]|uniref:protein-tyrosine phosphatase-like protein n=1 Tax=Cantharellus anzutake TaxID=1750568 RepID=UPI00190882DD|nr:protein-tyrosine phosphatase-like protein [Cantharellus anzutake]KAF8333496.1 protein-tyrosine phosphatase-like protein [Cantharellus anzutake]